MQWKPLRKGTTKLKVERQHATGKVLADNVRFRVDDDARMLDLSVDLTVSAADGLADFKSLTTDDRVIIDHLAKVLKHVKFGVPNVWRLHVALQGDHWFTVRVTHDTNFDKWVKFSVESALQDHPAL
jgi:hypothetical protein